MHRPPASLERWALALLAAAMLVLAPTSARGDAAGLAAALVRARDGHVAESHGWRRLIHYRPGFWNGDLSELDGMSFFLGRDGRHLPDEELEATLRGFFAAQVRGREDEHALCRFPARHLFLARHLPEVAALPEPRCPKLARYLAAVDTDFVSLVYASNYLSNPGSALGHTFLRLGRKQPPGSKEPAERLDYGVEYEVDASTRNPLLYTVRGLGGGFEGRIVFRTFEYKALEYGVHNDRDLWEYRLALSREEIELLVAHLWEVSRSFVRYYYLTENCSYHVLALLEAVTPRIDVLGERKSLLIPTDTVKAVARIPGIVSEVQYRASVKARVERERDEKPRGLPRDKAPDLGHGSLRATVGAGATSQFEAGFAALGFRMSFHDLGDPPDGNPELLQLQFLDTQLRARLSDSEVSLDRLTFAELLALSPLRSTAKAPSWRVRGMGIRLHDEGCSDCFVHGPNLSMGLTLATPDERVAVWVMADSYALFPGNFDDIGGTFARWGIGPYAGLRLNLPGSLVLVASGTWSWLPAQTPTRVFDLRATLRSPIARDVALGFEGAAQPESVEGVFTSYLYF
ncbi:MAG: DUF4105 domain-containing protein [Polyangiaceae bacterium]